MNDHSHTTHFCPRLSPSAPRFTTGEVLDILGDKPERKRNGNLRSIVIRTLSRVVQSDVQAVALVGGRP